MRKVILMGLLVFLSGYLNAQSFKKDTLFLPEGMRQFQFQLDDPVKAIDHLRYDQSGESIKGTLSPDGSRVVMENYKKGQRVKLQITHFDGKTEEIMKTPCRIDPVLYEL
jgi:hypothetical protein